MKPIPSLACYLTEAATRWPHAPALRTQEQRWTYREWLAEIAALAETIEPALHPLIVSGSSLDLARYAFACSSRNRPFQPVDRNGLSIPASPLPPGVRWVEFPGGRHSRLHSQNPDLYRHTMRQVIESLKPDTALPPATPPP